MKFGKTGLIVVMGLALGACSQEDVEKFPVGDASDSVSREIRGHRVSPKIIMGKAGEFFWVQRALSNYKKSGVGDLPSEIAPLPKNSKCKFDFPTDDEKLVHVHIEISNSAAPVYAISKKAIAKRASRYIDKYVRNNGKVTRRDLRSRGDRLGIVNVVVTEQQQPVYLVLTGSGNIIWNIQAHERSLISRVAIIGRGTTGIANLDPEVPVTSLTGKALKRCNVFPARNPKDHWSMVAFIKSHGTGRETVAQERKYARKYTFWFTNSFAQSADRDAVGDFLLSNVIVGPMPDKLEARVPYKSLKGAQLRLTAQDYVFASPPEYYNTKNMELVKELATRMSGGSLESLLPGS